MGAGLASRGIAATSSAISAGRASAVAFAEDFTGGERAENPLDERDTAFIDSTLATYRSIVRAYFRPHVRGLEHVPTEGPALLVGNHSGGTLIADTFVFGYEFAAMFGSGRSFHQLAHDMLFRVPGLAALRKYGMIPAAPENARRALAAGAAVLVYPGGDWETYRPSWESGKIDFGGRKGFIDIALEAGAPIVPVVAIGGQETALFLARGERASRFLGLDKMLRIKVLPVQIAPPFGITVLDLPLRIPLPAQITIQVLPPIDLRAEFGADPDRDEVYDTIIDEMQRALTELSEERDLPVVGTVGERADHSEVADEVLAGRSA